VEFRILGPFEVVHEGGSVRIPGAKERALLVLLLLHANEAVSVDRLIEELWDGRPPPTARKSLQVRVAALRRALGAEHVQTRGDGYAIVVAPDELDLHRYERLVAEGRDLLADGEPGRAVEPLRNALALWRGPPLDDFAYESFAQASIARLEEL
jgi:DNA-binding SARP family transcriptional activator